MSKLASLKSATSLIDVATLLNFSASGLSFVLYKQPSAGKYKKFQIPKKAGGTREICAPIGAMKALQRELATLLNECRAEIQTSHHRPPLSHGFREGLSIITNAHVHTGRRYVLNADLADFFPTFNFGRVRGFFRKDKDFELHERVATVLAQIACFENALPQGSPCSPVIADMIAHLLDVRLVRLAKTMRVTYSRYADDLTFSTNQKTFPHELALPAVGGPGTWKAGGSLIKEIEGAGFEINPAKTRMQFRGSRQIVTGLTVNDKVNVSQRYWRGIRSMCRNLYTKGDYHFPSPKAGTAPEVITSLAPLAGMLSHAYQVKLKSGHTPDGQADHVVYGHSDHARFWFFRTFVVPTRPVIVCEGVTDNIYLRNAIRSLSPAFPTLGTMTQKGFEFGVALFSYDNVVHKILDMTGGIGPLLKFIHGYRKCLKYYAYKPLAHPVIVLVDNDSALGAKNCAALKKHFGVNITHGSIDSFFHLTDNLYLVKTPLVGSAATSCIEDLFDNTTLATTLDGKVFHSEKNSFDESKHIGKKPFAMKIVAQNAATISWSGFAPLLDRIVAVLQDHHTKATLAASGAAKKI